MCILAQSLKPPLYISPAKINEQLVIRQNNNGLLFGPFFRHRVFACPLTTRGDTFRQDSTREPHLASAIRANLSSQQLCMAIWGSVSFVIPGLDLLATAKARLRGNLNAEMMRLLVSQAKQG